MSGAGRSVRSLEEVIAAIDAGERPVCTVRRLLEWYGARRRDSHVLAEIEKDLTARGLRVEPQLSAAYIDEPVSFDRLAPTPPPAPRDPKPVQSASPSEKQPDEKPRNNAVSQPSPPERAPSVADYERKVRHIPSATLKLRGRPLHAASPDDEIRIAVTTMLTAKCSILPVMTGPRGVRGLITWRSVAENMTLSATATKVQQCMLVPAPTLEMDQSLFSALPVLAEHDGAVVLGRDKTIIGIVTLQDVVGHLGEIARPFLLLGELEGFLRDLCRGRLVVDDWKHVRGAEAPENPTEGPDVGQLTFGDYCQLLGHGDVWERLQIRLDRRGFCASLNAMRELRNDVMHFSPDPVDAEEVERLVVFVDVCRKLRDSRGG